MSDDISRMKYDMFVNSVDVYILSLDLNEKVCKNDRKSKFIEIFQ